MRPSVRQATIDDVDVIVRFNILLADETEHIKLDQNRLEMGVQTFLRDPSKGVYYLAEVNNIPVGQTMITYEWSDWRNGNFWWIQSVYVEKAVRGTGVFRALFNHIHSLASTSGEACGLRLYVEKNNSRAKHTYAGLGMKLSKYEMYEMDFIL